MDPNRGSPPPTLQPPTTQNQPKDTKHDQSSLTNPARSCGSSSSSTARELSSADSVLMVIHNQKVRIPPHACGFTFVQEGPYALQRTAPPIRARKRRVCGLDTVGAGRVRFVCLLRRSCVLVRASSVGNQCALRSKIVARGRHVFLANQIIAFAARQAARAAISARSSPLYHMLSRRPDASLGGCRVRSRTHRLPRMQRRLGATLV